MSEEVAAPETARDRLLATQKEMASRALSIMKKKNNDYCGPEVGVDPLFNFRRHGLLGMLVRMDDKMSRLNTFVRTGVLQVEDEDLEGTLLDLQNYCTLFAFWVDEDKRGKK